MDRIGGFREFVGDDRGDGMGRSQEVRRNLGTVPDQPPPVTTPEQRQAIMDGLVADRKNAVYSDTSLTGQPTSSVAPPAPPPITPEGGGTTLGTPTVTPPAASDTGATTGATTDSAPDMPATPQTPVSSQPLPDAAPTEKLNRILWGEVKGWKTPYPTVKQSLFFPLAVDVDDDDREEEEEEGSPLRRVCAALRICRSGER